MGILDHENILHENLKHKNLTTQTFPDLQYALLGTSYLGSKYDKATSFHSIVKMWECGLVYTSLLYPLPCLCIFFAMPYLHLFLTIARLSRYVWLPGTFVSLTVTIFSAPTHNFFFVPVTSLAQ